MYTHFLIALLWRRISHFTERSIAEQGAILKECALFLGPVYIIKKEMTTAQVIIYIIHISILIATLSNIT